MNKLCDIYRYEQIWCLISISLSYIIKSNWKRVLLRSGQRQGNINIIWIVPWTIVMSFGLIMIDWLSTFTSQNVLKVWARQRSGIVKTPVKLPKHPNGYFQKEDIRKSHHLETSPSERYWFHWEVLQSIVS